MNTEPTINNRLAECLRQRHPEWRDDAIVSEQTGVLIDEPLKKPDVSTASHRERPGLAVDQHRWKRSDQHTGH